MLSGLISPFSAILKFKIAEVFCENANSLFTSLISFIPWSCSCLHLSSKSRQRLPQGLKQPCERFPRWFSFPLASALLQSNQELRFHNTSREGYFCGFTTCFRERRTEYFLRARLWGIFSLVRVLRFLPNCRCRTESVNFLKISCC